LWEGILPAQDIQVGKVTGLGRIQVALSRAPTPRKLVLTLAVNGTSFRNHYDLWVYPPRGDTRARTGVVVRRVLDPGALRLLGEGGRVLLLPEPSKLTNAIEGFFASDFWCYPMFRRICEEKKTPVAPGTLGLLCDPTHPALAQFPTEFHANWQWWSLMTHSRALVLDGTPADFLPIVQVIDNFERNHKLGLLWETRVGAGRLLVCSIDLPGLADHPEARQLMASLLAYTASDRFKPVPSLRVEQVRRLLDP